MTDTYAEQQIIEHFKTMESLSEDFHEVAFPNQNFTRPKGEGWYELYPCGAKPIEIELGNGRKLTWVGIFQINICVPQGEGTQAVNDRFDNVANLFKNGSVINGVRITSVYRSPARPDGDFYCMPVTISWRAYLDL